MTVAPVQAKATQNSSASTSLVGNLNTAPTQNNLLIATVVAGGSATGITPPAGWAAVNGPSVCNPSGSALGAIYWKKAGASEPSTWTWTATGGTPSCNSVTISEWSGADTTTAPQFAVANFSGNPFNTPTLTPSVNNCAILQCIAGVNTLASSFTGVTAPAACTHDASTGTSAGLGVIVVSGHGHDTANQTTATVTTARSYNTNGNPATGGLVWTLAVHPAPSQGLTTANLTLSAHEINQPYVHPVQSQTHIDSTGATTTITGTLPGAPAQNHKLLAVISCGGTAPTLTPPAGWTLLDRTVHASGNGVAFLYHKTAGASEPASWNWTASVAPSDYVVSVIDIEGGTHGTPQFAKIVVGTNTNLDTAVLTTTQDGCLILNGISMLSISNPAQTVSVYPTGIVQDTHGESTAAIIGYNCATSIVHEPADQTVAGDTSSRHYQMGGPIDSIGYTIAVPPDVLILRSATIRASGHGFRPTMKKWVAAREAFKQGNGVPVIVAAGASATEGFYAGPNCRDSDMWVTRLGTYIGARVGSPAHPGRYMPADVGPHAITDPVGAWPELSTPTTPGTTSPWSSTGAPVYGSSTYGLGARALRCTSPQTLSLPGGAGGCPSWATHAVLCYSTDAAGSVAVHSNGTTVDSFTVTGAVTAKLREIPITGGTTFAVDCFNGFYLEGVKWIDKNHGISWIEVIDAGHGGYQTAQYDNTAHLEWAAAIAAHNPVLIIMLDQGGNDIQAHYTAAQFQTHLTNVIGQIDAACIANGNGNGAPDYLIASYPYGLDNTDPAASITVWNQYRQAMSNVVDALGSDRAFYMDINALGIMPDSYGVPNQYQIDGVHPNAGAGSDRFAQGFADTMMNSSEGTIGPSYGASNATLTAQDMSVIYGSGVQLQAASLQLAPGGVVTPGAPTPAPEFVNNCTLDGLPVLQLNWFAPTDLSSFAYYEVQAQNPVTQVWETFAKIKNPTHTAYTDSDCNCGIPTCYRVRVVNQSGLVSAWTNAVCATAPVVGNGYIFSSNLLPPTQALAYNDVYTDAYGTRAYTFDEGSDVTERIMHGRDFVVAFRSKEIRGARFTRELLVSTTAELDGRLPSAPLIDLTRQAVPYICVRDEMGNRFFANVRVHSEAHQRDPEVDMATIAVEILEVEQTRAIDVIAVDA